MREDVMRDWQYCRPTDVQLYHEDVAAEQLIDDCLARVDRVSLPDVRTQEQILHNLKLRCNFIQTLYEGDDDVKLSEYYSAESKYLRASDIPEGREVQVVIDHMEPEKITRGDDETPQEKLVVYFKNKEKGLVLNATNGKRLSDAYGDDVMGTYGKSVVLYVEQVSFQGKQVPGLRLRIPAETIASEDAPF